MSAEEVARRAEVLLAAGRPADALALLGPSLAAGDEPAPHVVAVAALLALQRPAEAASTAGAALGEFGPQPALARVASYALRASGAAEEALDVARAGVRQAPEWVPGLLALIEAELALGHRADAAAALAVATELAPDSVDVRLVAADVALAGGDARRARAQCAGALALDPDNVTALRGLGLLDERRNRIGRAARWYAQALRLRPGDAELAERLRALFGRLLGAVLLAVMVIGFLVMFGFLVRADPAAPDPGAGLPDPLLWVLWLGGFGGIFAVLTWSTLRGVPGTVLDALVAEARSLRRVRRCARLTLAHAVAVAATALAALAPVGTARDRLPVVLALWLVSMLLMICTAFALRHTFGFAQTRAARPEP